MRRDQHGGALIEFALILPMLLVFLVGVVYYGYVFALQTVVERAADRGAQAAVSLQPLGYTEDGYIQALRDTVDVSVARSLDWLPSSVADGVSPATVECAGGAALPCPDGVGTRITVTVDVAGNSSPLLPQINLPPFGAVPPLPGNLVGVAEVTL